MGDMDNLDQPTPSEAGERMMTEIEKLFDKLREAKIKLAEVNSERNKALQALSHQAGQPIDGHNSTKGYPAS